MLTESAKKISMIPHPVQAACSLPFHSPSGNQTKRGSDMSKSKKTPMTRERASAIQSSVDRKTTPTPQQQAFKQRTTTTVAKKQKQ